MKEKTTVIRTTIVSSDDNQHTYEIRKELLDQDYQPIKGDDAILIGMYPTVTTEDGYKLDTTALHILSKMEELELRTVRIINLFSKVCKVRLSAKGLEVDKPNFDYIENIMKEKNFPSYKVIVAWGNSMMTCKACNHSKTLFAKLFSQYNKEGHLYQITSPRLDCERQETPHVLYMGIRHKSEPWDLIKYTFPKNPFPLLSAEHNEVKGPEKDKGLKKPKEKKTATAKTKPKLIYKA